MKNFCLHPLFFRPSLPVPPCLHGTVINGTSARVAYLVTMSKSTILEWAKTIVPKTQSSSLSASYSSQDFCAEESGGSEHPAGA